MDHLLPQAEHIGTEEPGSSSSSAEAAEQQRVEQLAKFQVRLITGHSCELLL
jgi:hypothetical protein